MVGAIAFNRPVTGLPAVVPRLRDEGGSLFYRWHLELDLGELVGGPADFAQERQPARVAVDFVE